MGVYGKMLKVDPILQVGLRVSPGSEKTDNCVTQMNPMPSLYLHSCLLACSFVVVSPSSYWNFNYMFLFCSHKMSLLYF